ncbi:hypothetical protein [Salinactinospora qingdaonensis]
MKRIKLVVPDDPAFDAVRDLNDTFAEVADPRGKYRFKRGETSVDFEATGQTADDDTRIEIFQARSVTP